MKRVDVEPLVELSLACVVAIGYLHRWTLEASCALEGLKQPEVPLPNGVLVSITRSCLRVCVCGGVSLCWGR